MGVELSAMLAQPRVIMFDWGGTLVHTHREYDAFGPGARGAVAALRAAGVPVADSSADRLHQSFVETWGRTSAPGNLREFDSTEFLQSWARGSTR
jgi:hypothetical protein